MSEDTPAMRSLRARIAINTRLAREDHTEMTAKARAGFANKWEREVDPDGKLDPAERAARADAAKRAHMLRLSLKAAQARMERRAA